MTFRVAAAAFAASALIAAPAAADPVRGAAVQLQRELGANTSLVVQVGHNDRDSYRRGSRARFNAWGQTNYEVRRLKRDAARACRSAISREAYHAGYRDVDFDDGRRVYQIGRYGFEVRYNDVEFESRRRDVDRDVTCTIRRGNVVRIEGIPAAHRGRGNAYGKDRRGHAKPVYAPRRGH